jgi:hypothetical protein
MLFMCNPASGQRMHTVDIALGENETKRCDWSLQGSARIQGTVTGLRAGEQTVVCVLSGSVEVVGPLTPEKTASVFQNVVAANPLQAGGTFDIGPLESGVYTLLATATPNGQPATNVRIATHQVTLQDNETATADLNLP